MIMLDTVLLNCLMAASVGGDQLNPWYRPSPGPGRQRGRNRDHIDTVHRAGFDTEITAGAFGADHGMHLFGGTEDGIDRAGLDALGATDAFIFADVGHRFDLFFAMLGIQWQYLDIQQISKRGNGAFATGWTLVDRFTVGDSLGIGATAGVATLTALGLREQGVDLIDNRVAFDLETNRGKSQQSTKDQRDTEQYQDGD